MGIIPSPTYSEKCFVFCEWQKVCLHVNGGRYLQLTKRLVCSEVLSKNKKKKTMKCLCMGEGLFVI